LWVLPHVTILAHVDYDNDNDEDNDDDDRQRGSHS